MSLQLTKIVSNRDYFCYKKLDFNIIENRNSGFNCYKDKEELSHYLN